MEAFLIYLGKVALAMGVFYGTFLILFRNRKQFAFNRLYLLVSMAVSYAIPLITITITRQVEIPVVQVNPVNPFAGGVGAIPVDSLIEPGFRWYQYLSVILATGVAGFTINFITGNIKAWNLVRKSRLQDGLDSAVRVTRKDVHPFSFFNKIIISEKALSHPNLSLILAHEEVHVKEKHTFDILASEILFLLEWINPFAWLLKEAIINNLEYKTDETITQHYDRKTYQLAMVSLADKKGVAPFLNAMNGSQLKSRIIMMKKKKINRHAWLRQLTVIPLLILLIITLSNKEFKAEVINSATASSEITRPKTIRIIVDGEKIPLDDKRLSKIDLTHSYSSQDIAAALGVYETRTAVIFNKDNSPLLLIKTRDYVDGSNPDFEKMIGLSESDIKGSADNSTLTDTSSDKGGEQETSEKNNSFQYHPAPDSVVVSNLNSQPGEKPLVTFYTKKGQKRESTDNSKKDLKKEYENNIHAAEAIINNYQQEAKPDSTIKIRGLKNATGKSPLFIVDGREIDNRDSIENIDPNTIKSISVLKDLTATVLYGDKAKDGVILINTKKSSEKKPLIFVDGKIMDKSYTMDDLNPNVIKSITVLKDKSATDLYGEAAKGGAILVTTKNNSTATISSKDGLLRYITQNIRYPEKAGRTMINNKIHLKVYATVNEQGIITNVSDKRSGDIIPMKEVIVTVPHDTSKDATSNRMNDSRLMRVEATRVIRMLPVINIPDLWGKTVEFKFLFTPE